MIQWPLGEKMPGGKSQRNPGTGWHVKMQCADAMYLKADEFYKSSPCCGVEFVPEQPKVYKGKDYTEETLNQIMGG